MTTKAQKKSQKESQKESFFLPAITDIPSAQKSARQGTAACILVIVMSVVMALIAEGSGGPSMSSLMIAELLLYGLLAMMIYRMSRVAAIAAMLLYFIEQIVWIAQVGLRAGNALVMLLFLVAFINSVRGTSAYHELRQARRAEVEQSEGEQSEGEQSEGEQSEISV